MAVEGGDDLLAAAGRLRHRIEQRGQAQRQDQHQRGRGASRPGAEDVQREQHEPIEDGAAGAERHAECDEQRILREFRRLDRQAQLRPDTGEGLGDEGGGDARDEHRMVAAEAVGRGPAQLLDHEQSTGDGRVEGGAHAGACPGGHQRPRLGTIAADPRREAHARRAAHLDRRAFAAKDETGAEGEAARHELDPEDAAPVQGRSPSR